MSQQQLAHALDVQRSTVANWEGADNITPGADRLRRLVSVCKISFEWLATGRGEMSLPDHVHEVPAVQDLLVLEDPREIRLILAWREAPARIRQLMIEMAESPVATRRRIGQKNERA